MTPPAAPRSTVIAFCALSGLLRRQERIGRFGGGTHEEIQALILQAPLAPLFPQPLETDMGTDMGAAQIYGGVLNTLFLRGFEDTTGTEPSGVDLGAETILRILFAEADGALEVFYGVFEGAFDDTIGVRFFS